MYWYDGSVIKKKRIAKGWTQKYVSTKTGLSRNQIIAMEKGQFTGGIKYLRKYLNLLGLKFTIIEEERDFPQLDELPSLFDESD